MASTLAISAIKMHMHPSYFSNKNVHAPWLFSNKNMEEAVHKVSHAVDTSGATRKSVLI